MTSGPSSFTSLRKLAGQHPDSLQFMDLLLDLINEHNDRARVLAGVSLLDGALQQLLLTKLIVPDKEGTSYLFGPGAPLRPFSTKIKLGFALSLYGPLTLADLEAIREVRNAFAHTMQPMDFKTPEVINVTKRINLLKRFVEEGGPTIPDIFTERQIFNQAFLNFAMQFSIMAAHPEGRMPPHILRAIAR